MSVRTVVFVRVVRFSDVTAERVESLHSARWRMRPPAGGVDQ